MSETWVKLYRKSLDNGIIKHPIAWQLFCWLLLSVPYKPYQHATKHKIINLKAGEYIVGRKRLSLELNASEQNIRTALKLLLNSKIITIESTNEFSLIRIVNWDKYQNNQIELTSESTNGQPTVNQLSTTDIRSNKLRHKTKTSASPYFQICRQAYLESFKYYNKGQEPIIQDRDHSSLKALLKSGLVTDIIFKERLPFFFMNDFAKKRGFSLQHFCHEFNAFTKEAVNGSKTVKRNPGEDRVHANLAARECNPLVL